MSLNIVHFFRKHSLYWKDINEFGIINRTYSGIPIHKMVGFNFVSDYDRGRFGRSISRQLAGLEAALPDTYSKKADALLALMVLYWGNAQKTEQGAAANP